LNDQTSILVLGKEVVHKDDQDMLEALGILQIWVLYKLKASNLRKWSPVLEKIASCEPAARAIVTYLLSFYSKIGAGNVVKNLLVDYLGCLTASTLWLLQ
jgi:hypothetical protein